SLYRRRALQEQTDHRLRHGYRCVQTDVGEGWEEAGGRQPGTRNGHVSRLAPRRRVSNDGFVYGLGGRPVHSIQVYRTDGTFVRDFPLPSTFSAVFLSTDPQHYRYAAEMEEPNPHPSIFIYRRPDVAAFLPQRLAPLPRCRLEREYLRHGECYAPAVPAQVGGAEVGGAMGTGARRHACDRVS